MISYLKKFFSSLLVSFCLALSTTSLAANLLDFTDVEANVYNRYNLTISYKVKPIVNQKNPPKLLHPNCKLYLENSQALFKESLQGASDVLGKRRADLQKTFQEFQAKIKDLPIQQQEWVCYLYNYKLNLEKYAADSSYSEE